MSFKFDATPADMAAHRGPIDLWVDLVHQGRTVASSHALDPARRFGVADGWSVIDVAASSTETGLTASLSLTLNPATIPLVLLDPRTGSRLDLALTWTGGGHHVWRLPIGTAAINETPVELGSAGADIAVDVSAVSDLVRLNEAPVPALSWITGADPAFAAHFWSADGLALAVVKAWDPTADVALMSAGSWVTPPDVGVPGPIHDQGTTFGAAVSATLAPFGAIPHVTARREVRVLWPDHTAPISAAFTDRDVVSGVAVSTRYHVRGVTVEGEDNAVTAWIPGPTASPSHIDPRDPDHSTLTPAQTLTASIAGGTLEHVTAAATAASRSLVDPETITIVARSPIVIGVGSCIWCAITGSDIGRYRVTRVAYGGGGGNVTTSIDAARVPG